MAAPEVAARVLARVTDENGCWRSAYALNGKGYVKVGWSRNGKKRTSVGHLVAYEATYGRVPAGFELDHLCRHPWCVNPDHLEPVPPRINQHRGNTIAARNIAKTHCPQGHPYDEANTYVYRSTERQCRTCMAERVRHRRASGKPLTPRGSHCKHGHEFTPENTRITSQGERRCRECMNRAAREYQRRRRAVA